MPFADKVLYLFLNSVAVIPADGDVHEYFFSSVQSLSAPVRRNFRTILLSSQKSGRLSLQLNKK